MCGAFLGIADCTAHGPNACLTCLAPSVSRPVLSCPFRRCCDVPNIPCDSTPATTISILQCRRPPRPPLPRPPQPSAVRCGSSAFLPKLVRVIMCSCLHVCRTESTAGGWNDGRHSHLWCCAPTICCRDPPTHVHRVNAHYQHGNGCPSGNDRNPACVSGHSHDRCVSGEVTTVAAYRQQMLGHTRLYVHRVWFYAPCGSICTPCPDPICLPLFGCSEHMPGPQQRPIPVRRQRGHTVSPGRCRKILMWPSMADNDVEFLLLGPWSYCNPSHLVGDFWSRCMITFYRMYDHAECSHGRRSMASVAVEVVFTLSRSRPVSCLAYHVMSYLPASLMIRCGCGGYPSDLSSCGITDGDLDYLVMCIDTVGRDSVTDM